MTALDVPALDRLVLGSRQQRLLALAVLLAAGGFVVCAVQAGAGHAGPVLGVTCLLAVLAAAVPVSAGPLVLVLWLAGYWAVGVPDPASPWLLPAAGAVLVVHVGSGLAAHGPASLVLDRVTLARWARRGAALAALTAAAWVACVQLVRLEPREGVWLSAVALGLVAAAASLAARRSGGAG